MTLLAAGLPLGLSAQDPISNAREVLRQWIEQEKEISELREDWERDKRTLEDIVGVLEREIALHEETIEEAEEEVSDADEKRRVLLNEQDELRKSITLVEARLGELEGQIKQLFPTLPEILQSQVRMLHDRVGRQGASISERMQNIVGILMQVDKFNSAVTLDVSVQEVAGESIEVSSIYFGLAGGYFVDASGVYAGYLRPGGDGWVVTEDSQIAPQVRQLVDIYENPQEATFVLTPATIQ